MLVAELPLATDLDKPDPRDGHWSYPPSAKFVRLLHAARVPIGLLFNGLDVRLIYAPVGESVGSITFHANDMTTTDGHELIDAMVMLLSSESFFTVDPKARLPQLLAGSRQKQAKVTNALSKQVTDALKVLVDGFAQAAQRDGWEPVHAAIEKGDDSLYGGMMTLLLRLIFLLYCEDRELLPVGEGAFEGTFSLQRLYDNLRADQGHYADTMHYRFGAYGRLIALFRAVYFGVQHKSFTMPPRRGDLFNPNVYPFLEGWTSGGSPVRTAKQADVRLPSVSDATVFAVLHRLIYLGSQRLSYRALDVEQIGSVYEAAMGFHVHAVKTAAVRLAKTGVWVTPEEILAEEPVARTSWLKSAVGLDRAAATKLGAKLAKCRDAASVLEALEDDRDKRTAVADKGNLILQPGQERRRTSSHYTPRSMTEPVVKRGLEPIMKALGPEPSSDAILALKICDPAMGSGAFLVETCRYLSDHLVNAWTREPANQARLTNSKEDVLTQARRLVAQRCLYGVDKNPFAVRLAKLSLWAFTLARDLPFTFMDHTLRCGDSLVGLTLGQIVGFDCMPNPEPVPSFAAHLQEALSDALPRRARLLDLAHQNGQVPQREKAQILLDADDAMRHVRILGDAVLWSFFSESTDRARRKSRDELLKVALDWVDGDGWELPPALSRAVAEVRHLVNPMHWAVDFPEAFVTSGHPLDCFVGNPPFLGGSGISGAFGGHYLNWLLDCNPGAHGNGDICAHFFRRCHDLLSTDGTINLIATNTIAQGDTCSTGLKPLIEAGSQIYSAENNRPWEGESAVTVAVVHVKKGLRWPTATLDGVLVSGISSTLAAGPERSKPQPLRQNSSLSFQGTKIYGAGFELDDGQREMLVRKSKHNAKIIQPYIGGEEINRSPTQAFDRYVINFGGMSLVEASQWTDLLDKVRRDVKPDRDNNNRENYRIKWWQFGEQRPGLYAAIAQLPRCLVTAQTTKHLSFSFQPTDRVLSQTVIVIASHEWSTFSVLQSRIHEYWVRTLSSTMKTDLRYTPSDCFTNFPFPEGDPRTRIPALERVGERYYEHRAKRMLKDDEGLTKTYNAMRDPQCDEPEVLRLRKLHEAMDDAVLAAYGWTDLKVPAYCPLNDDERNAEVAFKAEIMDRLYALNAARAEGEGQAAPVDKAPKRPQRVDRPGRKAKKQVSK